MKIEETGSEKIVVALTYEDLRELDITYDEMDYSNIETRRVIWTVLDEARRALKKPIDTDGRILIEVSPDDNGGCVMCFTVMPEEAENGRKKLVIKKDAEPLLFCADDADSLLYALEKLNALCDCVKSFEVFSAEERHYIIICPMPAKSEKIIYILCEYGDIAAGQKDALSNIYEHGKVLKTSE